jgi:glycosyltransferase involved in cell wall biosynthesis
MIVKNESKVITRLLESVYPLINSYCICDTGSTDNTIEIIETFFEKQNIPGKIVKEPFRDFGYNRTFALEAAADKHDPVLGGLADYLLLLDADMILQIRQDFPPDKIREKLTNIDKYAIHLLQGSDYFNYKNVRLVRNYMGFTYWGVTHEYVNAPAGMNLDYGMFQKDELFILDIGDGGAKSDKFERDIRLLKKGLEELPDNVRYTFYLANSYRDHGDDDLAIETYKRRAQLGGWVEEVWQSLFSVGKLYKKRGDIANALYYWLEAYHFFPNRIENLYEIINHYRVTGHNGLAYHYYKIAEESRKKWPKHDYLFTQADIYAYKLDYEFSIIGYYQNPEDRDMRDVCMKVLSCPLVEGSIFRNVLSNYKFYVKPITDAAVAIMERNLELLESIRLEPDGEFVSSTPSLTIDDDGDLVVCLRHVNYHIDDKGGYVNREHITTKNVFRTILGGGDADPANTVWESNGISGTKSILEYDRVNDGRYEGIEDVRIMCHKGEILYNGNRGLDHSIEPHGPEFHMGVEHGLVKWKDGNATTVDSHVLYYEKERVLEKNWVLLPGDKTTLGCIYKWHPLTIGEIDREKGVFRETQSQGDGIPQFFHDLRGSTNGVIVGDSIWFIGHVVSYEDRRYYYHVMVVLDRHTGRLLQYTPLWTFEKDKKVEYTLGFVYYKSTDRFLIGYSTMDRETKYTLIPKSHFDNMMIESR